MKALSLSRGKVTVVDDDVYEWASKFKWHALKMREAFYAARTTSKKLEGKKANVLLSREIMKPSKGLQIDHKDGDSLNNRRENLRIATEQQNKWAYRKPNKRGSSKYRGVRWYAPNQKWQARIQCAGEEIYLGYFVVEEDAALAYDEAAKKYFGEFACPNFK